MCDDLNEDFFWSSISVIPFPEFKKNRHNFTQRNLHSRASTCSCVEKWGCYAWDISYLTSEAIFGRTNNVWWPTTRTFFGVLLLNWVRYPKEKDKCFSSHKNCTNPCWLPDLEMLVNEPSDSYHRVSTNIFMIWFFKVEWLLYFNFDVIRLWKHTNVCEIDNERFE